MLGMIQMHAINGDSSRYVSIGAFASGTVTCLPPYPTKIAAGNTLLLVLAHQGSMTSPTGFAGWTALGDRSIDGDYITKIYSKDSVSGSESGTLSLGLTAGAGSPFMGGRILNYRNISTTGVASSGSWDASGGTAVSFQNSSTVDPSAEWQNEDIVLWPVALNTHSYTYSDVSFDTDGDAVLKRYNQRSFDTDSTAGGYALLITEAVINETSGGSGGSWIFNATASGSTASSPYAAGPIVLLRPG